MSTPAVPSFALIASYSMVGDALLAPFADLIVTPNPVGAGEPVTLLWITNNLYTIQVSGGGIDLSANSAGGSGSYIVQVGFSSSTALVLTGYNSHGAAVVSVYTVLNIEAPTSGLTVDVDGTTLSTDVSSVNVDGTVISNDVSGFDVASSSPIGVSVSVDGTTLSSDATLVNVDGVLISNDVSGFNTD